MKYYFETNYKMTYRVYLFKYDLETEEYLIKMRKKNIFMYLYLDMLIILRKINHPTNRERVA